MANEAETIVSMLRRLRAQQRAHWEADNAILPGVVAKALGLIHARAAWDFEYAKRLVFDHFKYEGQSVTRQSSHARILLAVRECLTLFQEELDPFDPGDEDWKSLEEVAAL